MVTERAKRARWIAAWPAELKPSPKRPASAPPAGTAPSDAPSAPASEPPIHAWSAGAKAGAEPSRARARDEARMGGAEDDVALAELAAALAPSAERLLETTAQGAAFARVTAAAWEIDLPPLPDPETDHAYHLFAVQIRPEELSTDRDGVLNAIQAENIGVGVHYRGVHLLTGFRCAEVIGWQDLPNADRVSARTLSLPLSSAMTDDEVEAACTAVRRVLEWFSC